MNTKTFLDKFADLKVIDSEAKKLVFETEIGNVTATYKIVTNTAVQQQLNHGVGCLQVVMFIQFMNRNVYTWGAMGIEDNAEIIKFFEDRDNERIMATYQRDKLNKDAIIKLLNL